VVVARRHKGLAAARVHETRTLVPRDIVRRDGIPVTTVSRTLLDLGDVLTPWQLANVLHEAEFRRWRDDRAIVAVLQRNRTRGAVTTLRAALELNAAGSAGTRSRLEDRYVATLLRHGIDDMRVNVGVPDGTGGVLECDFWWPARRLVIEIDGSGHDRWRTRREDAERAERLAAAGQDLVRLRPDQLDGIEPALLARLRAEA
jgi:very-short-patch-repair endonuclease